MNIKKPSKSAFTLVELMIVIAIIGLLAAVAIPNFVQARKTAQKNACVANLIQINKARIVWAETNSSKTNLDCSLDELILIGAAKGVLFHTNCPAGGTYNARTTATEPTACSFKDHVIPGVLRLQSKQVGNCSLIEMELDNLTIVSALNKISLFESRHPELRVTSQQLLHNDVGQIAGVVLRHEPKTNAIALERLTLH